MAKTLEVFRSAVESRRNGSSWAQCYAAHVGPRSNEDSDQSNWIRLFWTLVAEPDSFST